MSAKPVDTITGFCDFNTTSINLKKLLSLEAIFMTSEFLLKKSALSKSNGVDIKNKPSLFAIFFKLLNCSYLNSKFLSFLNRFFSFLLINKDVLYV